MPTKSNVLAALFVFALSTACNRPKDNSGPPQVYQRPKASKVTFNDVAPIIWERCACCHREGEAAPFSLISYAEVSKRQQQIREVIHSGYMPPWLPDTPHVTYENDTRLSDQQLSALTDWLDHGAPEGSPDKLPAKPSWPRGWQLGVPDLVVSMPEPFKLPADGPDVYRNFAIPIPTDQLRYVRAMEFRPGNYRIVHHAFMLIDPTRRLRELREDDGQPGFGGMDTKEAVSPDGHFIGWQPGRRPYEAPPDMPWRLLPHTDLVLQVHMQCTGKPEELNASVGLFFTDTAPKRSPTKLVLLSEEIDIPPEVSHYEIEDSLQLPVEVEVMAVAPHAHYLAKEMYGLAELPDGSTKPLLTIKDWDLNWQSEYRFKQPVRLPAGTILRQRYVYDNSAANIRNPNHPPQRVRFGPEATDEMGSLWIQVVTVDDSERETLNGALAVAALKRTIARCRKVLATNPTDVDANVKLGKAALVTRQLPTANRYFQRAAEVDPMDADALYFWGHTLLRMGNREEGVSKLRACLQLDPRYYKAYHDLGQAAFLAQDFSLAEGHFRSALGIHEYSPPTLTQLGRCLIKQGKLDEGIAFLSKSLEVQPRESIRLEIESLKRSPLR